MKPIISLTLFALAAFSFIAPYKEVQPSLLFIKKGIKEEKLSHVLSQYDWNPEYLISLLAACSIFFSATLPFVPKFKRKKFIVLYGIGALVTGYLANYLLFVMTFHLWEDVISTLPAFYTATALSWLTPAYLVYMIARSLIDKSPTSRSYQRLSRSALQAR